MGELVEHECAVCRGSGHMVPTGRWGGSWEPGVRFDGQLVVTCSERCRELFADAWAGTQMRWSRARGREQAGAFERVLRMLVERVLW